MSFAESIILVPLVGGPEIDQLEIHLFLSIKPQQNGQLFFECHFFKNLRAALFKHLLNQVGTQQHSFEKHLIWVPLVGGP